MNKAWQKLEEKLLEYHLVEIRQNNLKVISQAIHDISTSYGRNYCITWMDRRHRTETK